MQTETDRSARTDSEILARIDSVGKRDWIAAEREELIRGLSFEAASSRFLKPEVTAESWGESRLPDRDSIVAAMREYMTFAIGKALDHRGISAGRSVDHFRGWLWLLGDDETLAFAETEGNYAQYGAPVLSRICERYAFPQSDDEAFTRMAQGKPCYDGCGEGCGS